MWAILWDSERLPAVGLEPANIVGHLWGRRELYD